MLHSRSFDPSAICWCSFMLNNTCHPWLDWNARASSLYLSLGADSFSNHLLKISLTHGAQCSLCCRCSIHTHTYRAIERIKTNPTHHTSLAHTHPFSSADTRTQPAAAQQKDEDRTSAHSVSQCRAPSRRTNTQRRPVSRFGEHSKIVFGWHTLIQAALLL